ncbi:hypothetical protein [Marivivens aquimaris]|uniref:hypothetical protein n=1 Tax=Marivivens aquimaris TaxID=2774876 RepID=UPI001881DBD3|nr:hypothetical protein [Marivivens aquimaris]
MALVTFLAGSFLGLCLAVAGIVFLNLGVVAAFSIYLIAGITAPLSMLIMQARGRRVRATASVLARING